MTATTVDGINFAEWAGSSLRSGNISQLVMRTMASAIGSRKSARTHWNKRRNTRPAVSSPEQCIDDYT